MRNRNSAVFSSDAIKLLAITAMTIDHIAWLLYPGYSRYWLAIVMHIVGRITCPIMCFCIAEGYYYTRNKAKYAVRLLILAIISHFSYLFAFNTFIDYHSFIPFYYHTFLNQTSVVWSLLGGLCMLWINDNKRMCAFGRVVGIILICLLTFPADWSCIAALCILSIGTNRGKFKKQISWCAFYVLIYAIVYVVELDPLYGILQLCTALAIPILVLYNGKRCKDERLHTFMKYFFYIYYPFHLIIIGVIKWKMVR